MCFDHTSSVIRLPQDPVTLSVAQLQDLEVKLRNMRHDINNNLCLISTAVELLRVSHDAGTKMLPTLAEQPNRISEALKSFSAEFDRVMGITRS